MTWWTFWKPPTWQCLGMSQNYFISDGLLSKSTRKCFCFCLFVFISDGQLKQMSRRFSWPYGIKNQPARSSALVVEVGDMTCWVWYFMRIHAYLIISSYTNTQDMRLLWMMHFPTTAGGSYPHGIVHDGIQWTFTKGHKVMLLRLTITSTKKRATTCTISRTCPCVEGKKLYFIVLGEFSNITSA